MLTECFLVRCAKCNRFTEGMQGRCPHCGASQSNRWKSAVVVALVLGVGWMGYRFYTDSQLRDLSQKTGMQWDTEMRGDWVRTSESTIALYRIHIVDQRGGALGPEARTYHPGDKLVAGFHFRTKKAGNFTPRASLGPVNGKTMVPLNVPAPDQFKGTLIPVVLPAALPPGKYPLRLEVEDDQTHEKGFWETDVTVQ